MLLKLTYYIMQQSSQGKYRIMRKWINHYLYCKKIFYSSQKDKERRDAF